ncbi:hypothetical protein ACS0TY_003869 [Phlomoides rotata]
MDADIPHSRPQPCPETRPAKKKRKQRSTNTTEEVRELLKSARIGQSVGGSEEGLPWKNLQLILSLQDKNTDLQKKVDLAFGYVKSINSEDIGDIGRWPQALDTSRTVVFLNNWVQSVLISFEKKMKIEGDKPQVETSGSFLDLRLWKIFYFCLEESKDLHMPLTCSKDFLRVIHSIAKDASSCVNNVSIFCEGMLSGERLQIYDVVLDCISMVFSSHGGVANENLDLWILLMDKVLELALKIVLGQLDGSKVGNFTLKLSCYLFEAFAKFLRVHPTHKSGFHNFIDKLLEPLLHLLHVVQSNSCGTDNEWRTTLHKLVGEVLGQGLFHPTHIDGFLDLQSTIRYINSSNATLKEDKLVIKSYHRHLFDKVEMIVEKNVLALLGLGELLHLFVGCVTKHKGALATEGDLGQSAFSGSAQISVYPNQSRAMSSKMNPPFHSMNAELRKSIFDYCVQLLEYLLADLSKFLQSEKNEVYLIFNIPGTLKSINNLLATVLRDNLYLRTEDTTEGASQNFLRSIYAMLLSLSAKIGTSSFGSDEKSNREILISVSTEIIVSVHHLLNIEYEVVGDDLESLWTVVFSSAACCYSSMDVLGQPLLSSAIRSLSCRLIDVYSDLRQVDSSVFALCRAVRQTSLIMGDSEVYSSSDSCSSYSNSLCMLVCSSEFRLSLNNAIKAIPEGQASACLRQLCSDIKESLEWMKFGHQLRAELLGKVLCEAYSIILDSITVTSGNSYLVGVSLKNLLEIMRPGLTGVVSQQSDIFSVLVDGRILNKSTESDNVTVCWILVFFFRFVLSCRSLFRQAFSLMPPDASKKMSAGVMGDSLTIDSGRDWLELTRYDDKGFFSWILQPSATLLNVIHSVSDICIQNSIVRCAPLVYVLNAMALQRLADLNTLIKSSEYMLQWTQTWGQTKLEVDTGSSSFNKRIQRWSKCVTKMRKEAAGLAESMMGFYSSSSSVDGEISDTLIHGPHSNDTLTFAVASLDEKSLPPTLWWIICKNVDIWCSHAAKKHSKNFLTLIIRASISSVRNDDCHFKKQNMSRVGDLKKVTAQQIALEFLSNTISYEQRFVRRYLASRFCQILQKSVRSIFTNSGVNLSKSPVWSAAMSAIENIPDLGALTWKKYHMVPVESCNEQPNDFLDRCQCLLSLLMRMPEEFLRLKSSSLYINYILNLERFLVGILLGCDTAICTQNPYEIFRLFVTCRKVLQTLAAASSKENANESQSPLSSIPLLWLLKSSLAAIGFQLAFPKDTVFEDQVAIFSLLDQTSNVLLTVSRDQFESAITSLVPVRKLHAKRKGLDPSTEESDLSGGNILLNPTENLNARKSVLELAKALEEDLQKFLSTFRVASLNKNVECLAEFKDLSKLSSIIACSQGLFWGLAFTISDTNAVKIDFRILSSSYDAELMTRIKSCVDTCVEFAIFYLKALFLEDDPTFNMSAHGSNGLGVRESPSDLYDGSRDGSDGGCPIGKTTPSEIKGDLTKLDHKRKTSSALPNLQAFLTKVQHQKLYLKKSLLMEVFGGGNAEMAFFLRQLFIACSAILRLNLQIDVTSSSWSLFIIVVDISEFLLLEFLRSEIPHQFAFLLLDGIVKFLEELGSYFPHFDPLLSRDFYVKLIGLHLRGIGKCICLDGKKAKLASQETGSHSKQADQMQSWGTSRVSELKDRLRMSLRKYISKSSELHLLSTIQAVERALAGVQEGLMTNYEIVSGSSNGGDVSSVVAAGIDAFDLILEFVTGPRRLNMIKKHIQSLVACLLNIILHLQGPSIFYRCINPTKTYERPDSGSVILMSIELLTKISGKPSFFQIDACHIAQSLRVPGALFQYFLRLQISKDPIHSSVDRKISVDLYAACCRMLCTALKHHKSETHQCIVLLEDSVSALLHCLETVNTDHAAGRDFFAWEVQEAVICASSLRRVYEEVRQQKDVFGQCSFQFLSRYIWVYCGFGPAKNGITREVDEALKPGVYALIDSCSADDLQLLHTVFGEGPCRTTLAALQHDYKVHFQFQGKV